MNRMASEFVDDVINDIDAKPPRVRIILKWVIRISIILIAASFVFGQVKMNELNRLDNIEDKLEVNYNATANLRNNMENRFNSVDNRINGVNDRINKIYDDGLKFFNQYQKHNEKQLEIIIDYGDENKELLKKMIEINNSKQRLDLESQIIESKLNESRQLTINGYLNLLTVINKGDTIFHVTGATLDFIDNIDVGKYKINVIDRNLQNNKLYDVTYENR